MNTLRSLHTRVRSCESGRPDDTPAIVCKFPSERFSNVCMARRALYLASERSNGSKSGHVGEYFCSVLAGRAPHGRKSTLMVTRRDDEKARRHQSFDLNHVSSDLGVLVTVFLLTFLSTFAAPLAS